MHTIDETLPRSGSTGRRWTLIATSVGFAVVQLDVSVVNVAVRPIGAALGGDVTGMQWVVDAYTVAFAALLLTAGAAGDRLGARRMLVTGFAVFVAASLACGLAPTLGMLIGARAVQGLGAALLGACSLTLLNHTFTDPAERSRAVGLWAAGASAALSAGPLIGGLLISTLGWRSIFLINVPLGLAGIALTARFATETPRSTDRAVDLPGQLTAVLALAATAAATIEGGSRGFADPVVLGGYAVALVAAVAFLRIESRRSSPMLPLGLFRTAEFGTAAGIGLLVNIAFYGLIFVLSLFFQQAAQVSAFGTGLALAPMTAAILAANLLTGRLTRRFGTRAVIAAGAMLLAAGCAALLGTEVHTSYWLLLAQFVAIGFGLGALVPALTAAMLGSVPRERSGIASGTLNTARQTGSVLGVAVFGSLITGPHLISGLHLTLLLSVCLAVAAAASATRLARN